MKVSFNRLFVGFLLAALVIIFNYSSPIIFSLAVLFISLVGFQEFKKLCQNIGVNHISSYVYVFIALFIVSPAFINPLERPITVFIFQGGLMGLSYLVILLRALFRKQEHNFQDVAVSMFAIMHLGFLPSFFIWIRRMDFGTELVMIYLLTIALNDSIAMIAGRFIGRTPMSPHISPKKTIEGSLAGILAGVTVFYFAVKYYGFSLNLKFETSVLNFLQQYIAVQPGQLEIFVVCFLGLLLAMLGQVGDLIESLFKREAGVKNSGTLLLSHGGVLDRIDSHYFAVWFAYFVFAYLIS